VWLYFFLRQKELKRSKQLIYSNIEALKNQMNPHFIFNALNSVQYYIATEQKREANIFLSKLSGLVRNILDNSSRSQVNLAQEISRIKDYLELEHLRLNGLFKYSVSVQPELKVKSILLPPLLIQPVIENSIWHGFSDIDYMGELHIDFSVEKKNLVVTVMDNGVGMEIEKWKKSPAHYGSGNSIGLNNIVKRLYLISKIKNKEHKIEFNNIEKDPVKGTIIRLHIPQ
jgi:LytS/YehU family sensor histidine kinase